jgi:hypothetical protein
MVPRDEKSRGTTKRDPRAPRWRARAMGSAYLSEPDVPEFAPDAPPVVLPAAPEARLAALPVAPELLPAMPACAPPDDVSVPPPLSICVRSRSASALRRQSARAAPVRCSPLGDPRRLPEPFWPWRVAGKSRVGKERPSVRVAPTGAVTGTRSETAARPRCAHRTPGSRRPMADQATSCGEGGVSWERSVRIR